MDIAQLLTILGAMVPGVVMVNVGREQKRAFHEIEDMEWLFLTVFFALAGASLDPQTVSPVGLLTVGYVVSCVLGLSLGPYAGGAAPPVHRRRSAAGWGWPRCPRPASPWAGRRNQSRAKMRAVRNSASRLLLTQDGLRPQA